MKTASNEATDGFIYAEAQHPAMHEVTKYRYRPQWVNAFGKVIAYEWLWDQTDAERVEWQPGRNFETMAFLTKHNATR